MTSAGSCKTGPRGLLRPGDHDNRQPEVAGRAEFGERRLAAAVLANDHIDRFLAQKLVLRFKREGAAPKDDAMVRQVWRKRERLNRANKIEMLGRRREGPDLQAADRQKNALRFTPERGGGGGHIGGINPMIARLRSPRRARQNDKRNISPAPPRSPHGAKFVRRKDAWRPRAHRFARLRDRLGGRPRHQNRRSDREFVAREAPWCGQRTTTWAKCRFVPQEGPRACSPRMSRQAREPASPVSRTFALAAMTAPSRDKWLSLIGIGEDGIEALSPAVRTLLAQAHLVVGGARHLALAGPLAAETMTWPSPLADAIPKILARRGSPVCVLASGDPFFYGVGTLLERPCRAARNAVLSGAFGVQPRGGEAQLEPARLLPHVAAWTRLRADYSGAATAARKSCACHGTRRRRRALQNSFAREASANRGSS